MYNYGDQVLINLVSADSLYYIAMHKNMWFWHNCSTCMQYDSVASDLFMSRRNDQGNFFYQFH